MALVLSVLVLLGVATAAGAAGEDMDSREAFFERLSALCGAVFEGHSSFPEEGPFVGKLLRAEIADCGASEIRIPFAVGDDRSRTWVLTRSEEGLLLRHDHRHEDGTPDEITMYGGWATEAGSAGSQSFAADAHTKELIPEAATNVWTLELDPDGRKLVYDLERHAAPRFRATLERKSEAVARDVYPAFEPLAWLVGEWQAHFRPRGEGTAAPTMAFEWGDQKRSYLRMTGMSPTADGGLEPEYESMVVWNPVRKRFTFLTVYRLSGGRITEDGDIDILDDGAVRLNMNVHYAPGDSLPFSEGAVAGPNGATLQFQRTFFRQGVDGLRGVFRIRRDGAWVDPLPGMESSEGFPWRRVYIRVGSVEIGMANGTEREIRTRAQLARLLSNYDLEPWLFTRRIFIDEAEEIPHSHPVLTVNTDPLDDDAAQLATLLHEQFHWFRSGRMQGLDAALADLREIFPEVPSGGSTGARNERSTYLHLVICDLEFQALSKLLGEEEARRVLSGFRHYTWIYEQVLGNPAVRRTHERHGLLVPERGDSDAAG